MKRLTSGMSPGEMKVSFPKPVEASCSNTYIMNTGDGEGEYGYASLSERKT